LNTPSDIYRRIAPPPSRKFHQGLDGVVHGWIGQWERRAERQKWLLAQAAEADRLAPRMAALSEADLAAELRQLREGFRRGGKVAREKLIPALAAVREAATRCLGITPYVEQLAGALALHEGFLVEMATGEGKTLTAGLAAALAGWHGRPCHVITVNDYLVERDAAWMEPLYKRCGLKVAPVIGTHKPDERQKAYRADIVYVTSKELLADFLRDRLRLAGLHNPERWGVRRLINLSNGPEASLILRGLYTAIVDEADSVLIDEAVTPLIISSPHGNDDLKQAVEVAAQIAARLELDVDYTLNLRYGEVDFTEQGLARVAEEGEMLPPFWRGRGRREELLRQAIVARDLFQLGKQYIVRDNVVSIVDEFTGRAMPHRTWREGLHQAIEAKEGIPLTDPSETLARMSFQRFFRLFPRLSGMTGTAWEASDEFWKIYHLPVVRVPTHRPCVREQLPDRYFLSEDEKWQAAVAEIKAVHLTGRPVLVGTRSVRGSERLSHLLFEAGVEHRVLNATRFSEEAAIVSRAGEHRQVTIATNMAGRGTDIRLATGVADIGGLHVLATERHESERVDRQLFGRAGRQGDPGSAQAIVSLDDELIRRHLKPAYVDTVRSALKRNTPGSQAVARKAWKLAQANAQTMSYKQRAGVLKYDTWLDEALSFAGGV
jgi:preprotein translocase subunit SecA